jgi:hypothetical protein
MKQVARQRQLDGAGGFASVRKHFTDLSRYVSPVIFWAAMVLIIGPILVIVYTAVLRVILYVLIYAFPSIPLIYAKLAMYIILVIGTISAIITIREMWKSTKDNPPKSAK